MAGAGSDSLRDAYEPMLQAKGAPKASNAPSQVAEKSPSSASSNAPTTPSARPTQLVTGTRSPPQRDHSASHIGMVVTTVAIRPEPMPSFCAKPIRFMARNTMQPPTTAELRHCRAVGRAWPCHSAMSSITPPAHRNRMAFMSRGGMVCTAMPMAK
ncbi:hypothetical protein D3C71_1153870 [compost metagenome]